MIDRKDKIYVLFILVLVVLFFGRIIFRQQYFYMFDNIYQFWPWHCFSSELVHKGVVPLWNPYIYCGHPHLANLQSAIFYPGTILFYLFPFLSAAKGFIILHWFLAGLFMFLLMKSFGVIPTKVGTCFLCAVIFMFNGQSLWAVEFFSVTDAFIWLPLLFLVSTRAQEHKSTRAQEHKSTRAQKHTFFLTPYTIHHTPILVGIILGVQFLSGHFPTLFLTLFFLFCYLVYHIATPRNGDREEPAYAKAMADRHGGCSLLAARCSLLLFAGIVAILLGSIQFLPSWEFIGLHSARAGGLSFEEITYMSFPLKQLVRFVFPFFFGPAEYAGGGGYWVTMNPYFGILPLILATIAIIYVGDDRRVVPLSGRTEPSAPTFFIVVLWISLILAFGKYTPIFTFLYNRVPLFNMLRHPCSFLWLVIFCGIILSGFALQQLGHPVTLSPRHQSFPFCFLPSAHCSLLSVRCLLPSALCLLVIADLFWFGLAPRHNLNPTVDSKYFSIKPASLRFLKDIGYNRIFLTPKTMGSGGRGGTKLEACLDVKNKLRPNLNIPYHIYAVNGYDIVQVKEFIDLLNKIKGKPSFSEVHKLLNLLGVKYIFSVDEIEDTRLHLISKERVKIYENESYFPKAFIMY